MEDIFKKDEIPTFKYKDLDGKTLLMKIIDNEDGLMVGGTDVDTGITYVLFSQVNNSEL